MAAATSGRIGAAMARPAAALMTSMSRFVRRTAGVTGPIVPVARPRDNTLEQWYADASGPLWGDPSLRSGHAGVPGRGGPRHHGGDPVGSSGDRGGRIRRAG